MQNIVHYYFIRESVLYVLLNIYWALTTYSSHLKEYASWYREEARVQEISTETADHKNRDKFIVTPRIVNSYMNMKRVTVISFGRK